MSADDDEKARDRTNLVVLGIAAAIVLIGLLSLWLMHHYQAQENCRIEGRRDCDPIALPQQ